MRPKNKQPVATIEQRLLHAEQEVRNLQQKLDLPLVRMALDLSERLRTLEDDLADERRARQVLENEVADLLEDARVKNSSY